MVIIVVVAVVATGLVVAGWATRTGPFACDHPGDQDVGTSPEPMTEFIVAFHDDSAETRQSVLDEAGEQVDVTLVVVLEMALGATFVVQASEPLDELRQCELIEALVDTCEVRYAHANSVEQTN